MSDYPSVEAKEEELGLLDVGAALRVCSKACPYTLNDRISSEYYWLVQRSDTLGAPSNKAKLGFILKWQAATTAVSNLEDVGSVHLEDIKSMAHQAGSAASIGEGTITLHLAQSIRALKSCGGRTRLILRASRHAEDAKWYKCLKTLWEASKSASQLGSDFDDI